MSNPQHSGFLIPDDSGPISLFPLRAGGPLRFREATERDLWLEQQERAFLPSDYLWTAEMKAYYGAHYDAWQPELQEAV